jgi:predicted dehydrogenase
MGVRGNELAEAFSRIQGVNVAGLCDPDEARLAAAHQKYPHAQTWADLRGMFDSRGIDVVAVATCNHWHALAAIWAMQAGKDVYVEKPLANTHWEGQQVVAAAKQLDRICQVGTQQRSDPMQAQIKRFLHVEQKLGRVKSVRVNRYGVRPSIGKRQTPLTPPSTLNYDLWLGPAQDETLYRDRFHYDWHWMWNTGAGEMGNWGVHILDDVRHTVLLDAVTLPQRIIGGGARAAWDDAGETPNLHFAQFDADGVPVVISLCNLPARPGGDRSPKHSGPGSGYIVYCEGGRLEGQRGGGAAFDRDGQLIREFKGDSGMGHHQQNFIDAVRNRDSSILNASGTVGLHSTGWCHLANVAFRVAEPLDRARDEPLRRSHDLGGVMDELGSLLESHQLDGRSTLRVSQLLEFDPAAERFVGPAAEPANSLLGRQFRGSYGVPALAENALQSPESS